MSMGPLGGIGSSAAGSPLARTGGSEVERAQQDAGTQERRVSSDRRAEAAAGIDQPDGENHETAERDADGRRLWEEAPPLKQKPPEEGEERKSKDTTGQSGRLLDLSG